LRQTADKAGRSPEPQGLRRSQRPAAIAQEISVVIISQGFCGKRQVLHRIIQSQIRGETRGRRFLRGNNVVMAGVKLEVGHLAFEICSVVGGRLSQLHRQCFSPKENGI